MPGLQSGLYALSSSRDRYERLEEAILEALRSLALQTPILFVLDGMQWADTASLRLFKRLATQKIPGLLLVGLYRSDAVSAGEGLHQVLEQLDGHLDDEIHVPRLDPSTVYKITATFGNPQQLPPDFGLWAYSETQGNPLHLERLVQNYIEGPSEIRHPDERAKPRSLEDVIIRSLERLSNNVMATLRQAAVLGQTFHLDTLCLALDQPQPKVLAALNSALEAKLVHGHPTADRYNFAHPVIRETLYTEMLTRVRRRYHWRAALALQEKGPSHAMDAKIDLLAHHFLHAEDHEQALVYLARASRRARELGAYEDAIRYLDQAITLVEQLITRAAPDEDPQRRQKQRRDLLDARARIEETLQQKTQSP
jgi:predicted ATPase